MFIFSCLFSDTNYKHYTNCIYNKQNIKIEIVYTTIVARCGIKMESFVM